MQELCDEVQNQTQESEGGKMTELERLKADLQTLCSAAIVPGMRAKTYEQIEAEIILNEQRIAALEAEQSTDHLREKLAELTTILNAIPPACPEARALVQARIDSLKQEMQGNA